MAELAALGVAASVIAVIQITTKAASLTYEYVGCTKRAPGNVQKLVDELKSLTGVLTVLQMNAHDPKLVALQGLNAPLQTYMSDMAKLRAKLESKQKKSGWFGGSLLTQLQWPFGEKDTLDFVQGIERLKSSLSLAMEIDQLPRSKAIETGVQEIKESRQKEDIERIDDKRIRALDWLFSGAFDKRHIEISGRRKERTGQWIVEAPEVQDWHKNPGLLLGYGIPGGGKTFLCSRMVDNLQGQAKTAGYGVAYVYFNYKEQGNQRPIDVLSSLVKQLACQTQGLPQELENLHKSQRKPTCKELYVILLEVTKLFSKTFFVFDALDECDQTTQRRELLPLFHQMGGDGMHLFLTSREHPEDIQYSFQNTTKIKLWAKDEDIASYIEQKISENPRAERLIGQGNYKGKIISELIHCAKGMFLLVHFHIEYLCQQTTIRQILDELEKLKSSSSSDAKSPLSPTYDRAMATLQAQPANCTELAIRILSWLVKARKVLKVRELQLAVSVEQDRTTFDELDLPDIKTMLDVCASLVAVDENGNTVRLVHYTVQEYLLQNPVILEHANFKVAMACTTFLSSELFTGGACTSRSFKDREELYPLLCYAASNLPFHLNACEESLSKELVLRFLKIPGSISSYLQALFRYNRYPRDQTQLHIACGLEHCTVVQLLLENGAETETADSDGKTALHIAASSKPRFESSNIISIIRLLFDKGADVSAIERRHGKSVLHLAAAGGRKEVIRLLLEEGADVLAVDNDGKTALHDASRAGSAGKDSIVCLVEKGAEISAMDKDGKTVLHYTAGYGGKDPVVYLVEKGADISAVDNKGKTALHHAAEYGREDSVAYLVEKGVDISAVDNEGKTALHHAAARYRGKDSVVYLVEKGADISAVDNEGKTALHHAAGHGREDSVVILVEKGADISAVDNKGKTALHHAAAEYRGKDLVVYLVEKGADISAVDNEGKTALHHAAEYREEDSVVYLVEKGADISAVDNEGKTALHYAEGYGGNDSAFYLAEKSNISAVDNKGKTELYYAAKYGGKDSVVNIVEKGADISAVDNEGKTALHYVAEYGGKDSVVYLVEKGADISAVDNEGKTALHHAAARYGGKDSVVYLVENGADISAVDNEGKTALHHAAEYGEEDSVVYLVEKGADISAVDNEGKTALHHAAEYGEEDSVVILVEKGADISAVDNKGKTALHHAAEYGEEDSVVYLVEKGADISAVDNKGKTALHYAAMYGREDSVVYLVKKGADISAVDNKGKTALHYAAARYGGEDSVVYLVEKGADISAVDKDGKTALDWAEAQDRNPTVIQLLRDKSTELSTLSLPETAIHEQAIQMVEHVSASNH